MKTILLTILFTMGLITAALALPPLPDCYHTYAEVGTELQQLQTTYSDIAKRIIIGYTQQDSLPIYAFKISDHVNDEESEPAVLFIGQVHAEEVLGLETTMSNINTILAGRNQSPYQNWIYQLEMWFIPTLNPEGHTVVTDNLDPSYRKNKRDANNNGIFDFSTLLGFDDDGVDINRNFGFNWCHGDTMRAPASDASPEAYDYYRGSAPFSESESRALKAFCDVQKPVFCIVWHSSRSGRLSEKVFYPMNWAGTRPAPDLALGQQIGTEVAAKIHRYNGSTGYEASASLGRKGDINNFLYKEYGTICLVIECGTSDLQPVDSIMVNIINQNTMGVEWLLHRALPNSPLVVSNSMLAGTIKDANTSQPLEAEIIVQERNAPWFAPRKSDPVSGRFYRPISSGTYTIEVRKKGYMTYFLTGQNVYSSLANITVNMIPYAPITFNGEVKSSNGNHALPALVKWYDLDTETIQANGDFMLTTYPGAHRIEITAEGYYPYVDTVDVNMGSTSINQTFTLSPITTVFSENWENGMTNWTASGPWVIQNELAANGNAITDSWGGRGFYAENANVWIKTNNPISIPSTNQKMLVFDEHLYTEFVYDSVRVEVSTDNNTWQTIYSKTGQYDWWHPVYVPLDEFYGQSLYFRFRLTDHSNEADLTDPGWTIDNIRIITGSSTVDASDYTETPPVTILYPSYPNPFKTESNLKFSVNKDSKVSIDIYNLKGQKVRQLTNELYKSGTHNLKWNGLDDNGKVVSSGIYFCKMHSDTKTHTLKMVLMK